jgi:rubrerythrin
MFKTDENLQEAFASESQAYVRYSLFAAIAEQEGWPEVARLFRAAAEAELVHSRNHFSAMGGLGPSKSNLLAAATSEQSAITAMYPGFLDQAKIDRNEGARISFEYALQAEKGHNKIFEKAYQSFKEKQQISVEKYSICSVCGSLFVGGAPASCDVCGNGAGKIREV